MKPTTPPLGFRLGFFVIALCGLLSVALLPPLAQAAPPALPPRPTPQPTATSTPMSPPPLVGIAGGVIELRVQFSRTGVWQPTHWQELWTVVQWQDGWGNWHDVEGWQGTLDETTSGMGKVWWVARADFDKGPFRWVVYQGQHGKLLASSEAFRLPRFGGEVIMVEVSFAP